LHFTGYNVKAEMFPPSFAEGELRDLIEMHRDAIRQSYSTPPEIYGDLKNSNRSTIDAADYMVEAYAVEPLREDMRHTVQCRLAREWDDALVLDYDSEIPEDMDRRVALMKDRP